MATDEQAFFRRLLATFKQEADDHVKTMSDSLRAMADPLQASRIAELTEILFREAHSLKGAARAVDLVQVEGLCHGLETVLARLRNREIFISARLFDVLYQALDQLAQDIDSAVAGNPGQDRPALRQALLALAEPAQQEPSSNATPPPLESIAPIAPVASPERAGETEDTVRISTGKLARMFEQVEELMAFKFTAGRVAEDLRDLHGLLGDWERESGRLEQEYGAIRRAASRGAGVMSPTRRDLGSGAADVAQYRSFVRTVAGRLVQLEIRAESDRHLLSTMLDALQDEMKQALMLPFSALFEVLPRMVRDLARERGKEVELVVQGEAVEIDRRIQEQIKAPLIHLIRNAVDHGLETPGERRRRNKAASGRILVGVLPKEGNKVELSIADDGAGLDVEKIKRSALALGIRTGEQLAQLTWRDAADLIFESGLSTSATLTDVSGRGLGMAIVREKIEKVGGTIDVDNVESGGTCFRITLPATLATFRGLLVEVAGMQFVLPSLNVESVRRLARTADKAPSQTIDVNGTVLPLRRLRDILHLESRAEEDDARYRQIVVLAGGGARVAVSVDEIVGDQEIVVKGLGPQLVRVPNVSAVTLLDGGRIVPILNVQDVMKAATAHSGAPGVAVVTPRLRSVLIVEDSATSRIRLHDILESAGYVVTAAADGVDALVALGERHVDLVVSDIEMPRMDGFTLTERIRADRRLRAMPIVLVTTLDSAESRERGLAAGANAYIAKGGFDQADLLETIRRLI